MTTPKGTIHGVFLVPAPHFRVTMPVALTSGSLAYDGMSGAGMIGLPTFHQVSCIYTSSQIATVVVPHPAEPKLAADGDQRQSAFRRNGSGRDFPGDRYLQRLGPVQAQ